MARKKKQKITVKLDLPKDDTTLTKLYAILFVSIFLGLCTATVWVTNSGFIPTQNGEPMFTNLYCGITAKDADGNPNGRVQHQHQTGLCCKSVVCNSSRRS